MAFFNETFQVAVVTDTHWFTDFMFMNEKLVGAAKTPMIHPRQGQLDFPFFPPWNNNNNKKEVLATFFVLFFSVFRFLARPHVIRATGDYFDGKFIITSTLKDVRRWGDGNQEGQT
jgi:hypothetical protein